MALPMFEILVLLPEQPGQAVHAIVIPAHSAAPVNSDAIKTSAGALQQIPVCREKNYELVLKYLQLNGIQIIGADGNAAKYVFDTDLTVPTAIIMGAEDEGISALSRKYLTTTVKIPLQNNFDSYNVSVAAGMLLYEVMRQRM